MWPFDLRGPDFLVFYLVAGAIVLTAAYLLRHAGEPEDAPKVNLSDPYLIAFLRGGKNEALRVVTMSLLDRGLLIASVNKIAAAEGAPRASPAPPRPRRPHFRWPRGRRAWATSAAARRSSPRPSRSGLRSPRSTGRKLSEPAHRDPGARRFLSAHLNDPKVEKFLATLYTDPKTRARFLEAPREEAARAGLNPAQCESLAQIDRVGLEMAARSFERKRAKK
jgi:hypothetical protein